MLKIPILEIAATSLEEAQNAVAGGAESLEICCDLQDGGLTPPLELVRVIRDAATVTLNVMIRSRAGNFVYTPAEMETMITQVEAVKPLGINGVVFGALTEADDLDQEAMRTIVHAAAPLPVTLHRALDSCRTPEIALQSMIGLFSRVLTSGPASTAWDGREAFRQWMKDYGAHYRFASSGGITMEQLPELVRLLNADEYHIGGAARTNGVVDATKVRQLKALMVSSAAG